VHIVQFTRCDASKFVVMNTWEAAAYQVHFGPSSALPVSSSSCLRGAFQQEHGGYTDSQAALFYPGMYCRDDYNMLHILVGISRL